MKRVLVITYYWPPSGGSGVQRWVKFAKYLPQEGWQPVIYTPENPEYTVIDHTLGAEIPQEAEILRRPILEPYNAYRRLMGKGASTDLKTLVTPISGNRKGWKQRLSLWIRANLFLPDPRVGWVKPSVAFLKQYLAEHPVDVLVTTGPPQSMHLIGRRLHEELGIPWIPDFRDPWTKWYNMANLPLTARSWRKHRRLEQQVLDDATAVLTVSPFVQRDFQAQTNTPVAMVPNGFDAEDYMEEPSPDGFFNLTQTGFLSAGGNPVVLWKVLGEMAAATPAFREALRIRLCGLVDPEVKESIVREGLASNLVDLGYQPHAEAVREQQNASVLLLPLRDAPEMRVILPGKLFEYMAARRPILGFGQTDGAQALLLQETGTGVMVGWDDETAVKAFVGKAWRQHVEGGVPATTGDIDRFSRRSTTHELALLLDRVSVKPE